MLLSLCLTGCKPVELRYMDTLGRKVVIQRDTLSIQAGLQKEGMMIRPKIENTYYWYENGRINSSQGAYSGKLLHGNYREYDRSTKQLLVSGEMRKGLKEGKWLSWNESAQLQLVASYKRGKLKLKSDSTDTSGLFYKIRRLLKFKKK